MSLDVLATTSQAISSMHFGGCNFGPLSPDLFNTTTNQNEFFCCNVKGCQREFTSKRNLVDHTRGHHQGNKPHTCSYPGCGKSFLRPAHLLIHTRIHTGEKPFVCEYPGCGKRWNQKSALKQHLRSHTGEKPFVCTLNGCAKRFSTSSSCKRHILTHGKIETVEVSQSLSGKRKLSIDSYDEHPTQKKFAMEDQEQRVPVIQTQVRMNVCFLLN